MSSNPILSTRHLISRLNCRNDLEDFNKLDVVPTPDSMAGSSYITNYKNTFFLDESSTPSTSSSSMQNEEKDRIIKVHLNNSPSPSNDSSNKKMLSKRQSIENNKIEHNELIIFNDSKHTNSTEELRDDQFVNRFEGTTLNDSNKQNESNLPNLKTFRSLNSSFQAQYNRNLQRSQTKKYTFINNSPENFNNVIKIRRIFDGETLKINQMPLNSTETKSEHMKQIERRIKSATVNTSNTLKPKNSPIRLIKSAEQHTDTEEESLINIIESLVTNTNTKTPSDESLFKPRAKPLKKSQSIGHRNSITSDTRSSVNTSCSTLRKTKSAGSKVQFNENLLRAVNVSSSVLNSEKDTSEKQSAKSTVDAPSTSNMVYDESIIESKIIELKDNSSQTNSLSNEPVESYQKSIYSQNSFDDGSENETKFVESKDLNKKIVRFLNNNNLIPKA